MEASVDIARASLDVFAGGDPDAIAAFVTDDFVNEHLSELGSGCAGRTDLWDSLSFLRQTGRVDRRPPAARG